MSGIEGRGGDRGAVGATRSGDGGDSGGGCSRIAADDPVADMRELEDALQVEADDDQGDDGLSGLEELGEDVDALRAEREEQRPARRQQARDEDGDEDELTPQEWRDRNRQKSGALREARQQLKALQEADQRRSANLERLLAMAIASGRDPRGAQGGGGAVDPQHIDLSTIDVKRNPIQALQAMVAKVHQHEQNISREHEATEATKKQAAQVQTAMQSIRAAEGEFAAVVKDYHKASQFYIQHRLKTAQAAGQTLQQAQQGVFRELLQTGAVAAHIGENPAALIYRAARAAGYVRGRGDEGGGRRQDQGQRRRAPAPAYEDDFDDGEDFPEARQRLERIERGKRSGRSFGSGERGGGQGDGVQNILDLENEDFDAAADKFLRRMKRGGGGRRG